MCLPAVHQSQRTESEDLVGYAVQSLEQDAEMEAFESMFRLISVETRKINQKIRNIYVAIENLLKSTFPRNYFVSK